MTGGWGGMAKVQPDKEAADDVNKNDDLDAIKKQLAELQSKLSNMK